MATLILSSVGGLLGGKIGRAVGAVAGNLIDRKLFGGKGREGPRLGDLAFQSSQYGALIPKLYGVNRVAGTVIWATDLREDRRRVSAGKGQPKTTQFSYSASFAVALSARPILRVGRIWADANLLRGAGGDFKTPTGFRLHLGDEAQGVDPLIASVEGIGMAPAYRGMAYVVFENFQLAAYGNRIPSLSFEVFADDGPVTLGAVIADVGGGAVIADCPTPLDGFAAYGTSVRSAIEVLAAASAISVRDDGTRLRVFETGALAPSIDGDDLGSVRGDERVARLAVERRSASTIPETLSIAYYDPARDYQQSVQRARRDGGARREARIEAPLVLGAGAAKMLAEAQLDRLWAGRVAAKVRLPWRRLDLTPGAHVRVAGHNATWRVNAVSLDRMVVEADLERLSERGAAVRVPADPGRSLASPDRIHGPTTFHLIDLPPLEDGVATAPRIVVAAAGASAGWRNAALLTSIDGGASWQEAGATASPAVIGSALGVLGAGTAQLIDAANSVDVELLGAHMELGGADAGGLDAMRNLAMLGDELIQFRSAVPLGQNRYRLSGLYRGRRGTEWAMAGHSAGERFVLIDGDTLAPLAVAPSAMVVRVMAVGIGDPDAPPEQALATVGQAIRPLPPAHLSATLLADGDTRIGWVRRSRDGWRWVDGVDAPLAEEAEHYVVTLTPAIGAVRVIETSVPYFIYTTAMRAADQAAGAASLTVQLIQRGTFGLSRPATIPLAV
jgi:Putative phage tail protein